MPTTATESRICAKCLSTMPIEQFRLRQKGGIRRHPECNACFLAYQRSFTQRRRRKKLKSCLTKIAAAREDVEVLANLCRTMLRSFGGPNRFAAIWQTELEAVMTEQPGSRLALKSLEVVARLMMVAERAEQDRALWPLEEPDLARLSDAELDQEIERQLHARGEAQAKAGREPAADGPTAP